MCSVLVSWQASNTYPLVIAGNRDEYFARPSEPAHWWDTQTPILAGKDQQAGGTWMGINKRGRFAVVTNYRDIKPKSAPRSRGELVTQFLTSRKTPKQFAAHLESVEDQYAGFNLLFGDHRQLHYFSNRSIGIGPLAPGVYAVSKALLNTPWPKVNEGKAFLREALNNGDVSPTKILEFLNDKTPAKDDDLPFRTLPLKQRRLLSAPFIVGKEYGTRASTILSINHKKSAHFFEQRYRANGRSEGSDEFSFKTA